MRDVTAHKYQTLRMEDVWLTVKEDIPLFKSKVLDIFNKYNSSNLGILNE